MLNGMEGMLRVEDLGFVAPLTSLGVQYVTNEHDKKPAVGSSNPFVLLGQIQISLPSTRTTHMPISHSRKLELAVANLLTDVLTACDAEEGFILLSSGPHLDAALLHDQPRSLITIDQHSGIGVGLDEKEKVSLPIIDKFLRLIDPTEETPYMMVDTPQNSELTSANTIPNFGPSATLLISINTCIDRSTGAYVPVGVMVIKGSRLDITSEVVASVIALVGRYRRVVVIEHFAAVVRHLL